jgi:hypothetical protein
LTGCDDPFKDPKVDDEIKVEPVLPAAALPGTIIDSIVAGGSQLFTANFSGDVTWTVEPLSRSGTSWTTKDAISKQTDTTMNTWGLLTVSLDEQAEGLRVMASANGKTGSYDLARLPSSQTMSAVVAELSEYISSRDPYTVINVTDTGIEIPYSTTIKVPTGQTLTIPKGVTVTFKNKKSVVVATPAATEFGNVFNGDVIVRGTLVIEDGTATDKYAEATGTGTITVENGGVYTEATSIHGAALESSGVKVFKFFPFGKTVVKYGGTLKANSWLWLGGTVTITPSLAQILAFIGADADSIIRPSVGGEVVINKYNITNVAYDYDLKGPVVINEGKTWKLAPKDTIKIGIYDLTAPDDEKLKPATLTVARRAQLNAKANVTANIPPITMVDGSSIVTQGSGEVYVGGGLKIGDGNNSFRAVVANNDYPIVITGTSASVSTITLNSRNTTDSEIAITAASKLYLGASDSALSLHASVSDDSTDGRGVFTFTASTNTSTSTVNKPVVLANGTEAITIPAGSSTDTDGASLVVSGVVRTGIDFGAEHDNKINDGILLGFISGKEGKLTFASGTTLGKFVKSTGSYTEDDVKFDTSQYAVSSSFACATDSDSKKLVGVLVGAGSAITPERQNQTLSAKSTLKK